MQKRVVVTQLDPIGASAKSPYQGDGFACRLVPRWIL